MVARITVRWANPITLIGVLVGRRDILAGPRGNIRAIQNAVAVTVRPAHVDGPGRPGPEPARVGDIQGDQMGPCGQRGGV